MKNKIKIEKGIKLPPQKRKESYPLKYPLDKMDVGDSFFIETIKPESPNSTRTKIISEIRKYIKTNPEKKFTTRTQIKPLGIRAWRIK